MTPRRARTVKQVVACAVLLVWTSHLLVFVRMGQTAATTALDEVVHNHAYFVIDSFLSNQGSPPTYYVFKIQVDDYLNFYIIDWKKLCLLVMT